MSEQNNELQQLSELQQQDYHKRSRQQPHHHAAGFQVRAWCLLLILASCTSTYDYIDQFVDELLLSRPGEWRATVGAAPADS